MVSLVSKDVSDRLSLSLGWKNLRHSQWIALNREVIIFGLLR